MLRRIIGIALAVVLATAGTIVLVLYVRAAESRALAGERIVDVLIVTSEIPRGTAAEELDRHVTTEQIPAKIQTAGSVADLSAIAGQVAAVDLLPGEQVTAQRFIPPATLDAIDVPAGLLQVTVSLDPARALGGRLEPGDTVAVLASFTDPAANEAGEPTSNITTHLILNKVLVTAVQHTPAAGGSPQVEDLDATAPAGSLLVTLAIDAPAVERVVFAAEHGSLWLSAEPSDAPEDGTRIQTLETIFR